MYLQCYVHVASAQRMAIWLQIGPRPPRRDYILYGYNDLMAPRTSWPHGPYICELLALRVFKGLLFLSLFFLAVAAVSLEMWETWLLTKSFQSKGPPRHNH